MGKGFFALSRTTKQCVKTSPLFPYMYIPKRYIVRRSYPTEPRSKNKNPLFTSGIFV